MSSISPSAIRWNKLLAIVLLVLLVGYIVARPTLERWWGIELPALVETPGSVADDAGASQNAEIAREQDSQEQTPDSKKQESTPGNPPGGRAKETGPRSGGRAQSERTADGAKSGTAKSGTDKSGAGKSGTGKDPFQIPPPKAGQGNAAKKASGKWELQPLDRGRLLSPAGLIYARGPQGEHRVDHVMRHAEDDPNRPQHGVFHGSKEEILQLIDEAYQLIQQNSKRVNRQVEGDRTEYTIRFDRPIGYEGGRNGKRNNHPQVNRLRLVLEDEKSVITAYPVR